MVSLLWLALASPAVASFVDNLNYGSPSRHHPDLGISIRKVAKRSDPGATFDASKLNFTHGVASGDPYPNSIILWTRCAPTNENVDDNSTVSGIDGPYVDVPIYDGSGQSLSSKQPVCLDWVIAEDEKLKHEVHSGTVFTSSDVDYTVKVEAAELKPFQTYYFQFTVCGSKKASVVGRTKTAPLAKDQTAGVRLAVYSCSNFPFGFFNAYGNPARKESVDYVVHLGDYIYEYANGDYGDGTSVGRIPLPDHEIYTLYDYRKRHATYKTDQDLLLSHQQFAWIPVWDDHEVSDNTYRDGASELNNTEASFIHDGGISVDQRKMNAVRAYFEWMPIRQVDMDDSLRIWRNFQLGSLIDLVMLDSRQYDRSITDLYWNTEYIGDISDDSSRSLLGPRQESWFYKTLKKSATRGATWRIIGSQIVFARLNLKALNSGEDKFNYDAWDGYLANRNRTLRTLYENNIDNNIFIAGDSHANWVSDVVWLGEKEYDEATGEGAVGVEFAGTAVSSPSSYSQNITLAASSKISKAIVDSNPELQWAEGYYRGYFELHVTHEAVQAQFFGMPTVTTRNAGEISLANFTVKAGENKLQRVNGIPSTNGAAVENGALKNGQVVQTNVTNSTDTGKWYISHEDKEVVL